MTRCRSKWRRLVSIVIGAFAPLMSGCGRDLIFTTYTTVGVEVKGVNNIPTALRLGYKRFEGAVVPVDLKARDAQEKHLPAHSIFAGMEVEQKAFGVRVAQVFATGEAAKAASAAAGIGFAKTLKALKGKVGIEPEGENGGS